MDDSSFAATAAAAPSADVDWLARLARILGLVGGRSVTPTASDVVDIASTGGPGSLSTLIAPLYARALHDCKGSGGPFRCARLSV